MPTRARATAASAPPSSLPRRPTRPTGSAFHTHTKRLRLKPTPTPTPSETGKPTDPPSSPAPDPSTPGDDGTPTPPGNKPDPDGDLADTGSSTPVGLFVGIAAALAVAGGALMWWMRRRRTAVQE
ncbi:LAETG motif-containing sortase-dependent surface protein [Streptomyces anulatus]|uniref:LAETG motif-containing sortase-dependent surface protein n=1 Tax=Streptomyces anulatus TaxID=1892 RepID=UPI001C2756F7|nr:LAETG motif-containing sortase-dependent surface protein [Streptomyces anulatus]